MPLPLKIVATPHAHDAQIVLIDDLLRKPSIYGPASRLLGEAFTNYVDNLPQRLCIGERAAALAKYGDKPVGTIVYNQSPEDPSTTFLELIVTREKYRRRKVGTRLLQLVEAETALHGATQLQTLAPQRMPGLQNLLAGNGFYFSRMKEGEGLFLRYKKDLKRKDDQQKTGLPPESLQKHFS